VNRAERRKIPPPFRAIAVTVDYRCPDCDNDVRLHQDERGVWRLDVMHDDTCPWLKRHEDRIPRSAT
jgi:hypothetical protein